ncbi:DUF1254 domain-containing protein [Aliiruegeria sabulilitoris]|uniref:DUF1254 domain-containing protein n=1 Tax=Aliiruegeria sabulilitoris TaxID=1510458 RepID=UPI00082DEB07|nr:DUF1254 domain-containing protein [Aliiruegeria sabulilitoris]NDR58741.1 DUF1254 domain-containing protein [Pseudoruegeria sp. M32A2M]
MTRTTLCALLLFTALVPASHAEQSLFAPEMPQTAQDFQSAPMTIDTSFGTLTFSGGGFPTEQTAQALYDELDLQRATQAYMDFLPALSLYSIVKSQARDLRFETASDIGVMAEFMNSNQPYLTGNNSTIYAFASLDLGIDGPTIVEIPPGMYGTANDAAFRYLTDFGATGPDKGEGGKYLFLPPGHDGDVPDGYIVMRSNGHRIWAMMRGFGEVGTGDQALEWFRDRLKVYPLGSDRQGKYVNASVVGMNPLPPEDGSAFVMLNEIIQHEPSELFDAEQLGRLASLGIEKGKPFAPDARMMAIFDQGAKQGTAMSRAIVYASREPDIRYWPDRQWEKMFVRNTEFTRDSGANDIDARTLWHYQAIVVSPNLLSTTPGVGTAYLTAFRDANGGFLDGRKPYRLRVPANAPVKRFWAVTAYDPATRGLLASDGQITVGSQTDPVINADGSVDLYFGQSAPEGFEVNWIKTDPSKGFFTVFRFYGPLEGYIEKSWVLNDFELLE